MKKPRPASPPPCFGSESHRARRAGFTAIEVTAVATIIAILALILIPIVRTRVEESKKVAAQDDMAGIEKAEEMAYGYTNHYFRLQDLNRPEPTDEEIQGFKAGTNATAAFKIPDAYWDRSLLQSSETSYLVDNWKGPYYQFHHSAAVGDLARQSQGNGFYFHGDNQLVTNGKGPILLLAKDEIDWLNPPGSGGAISGDPNKSTLRQYPVDPWGNPYLFFGSGAMSPFEGMPEAPFPFPYPTAAVYSMGPDGMPGSQTATNVKPEYYFREGNVLGTGDDLKREF